jgi:hypothetical protein
MSLLPHTRVLWHAAPAYLGGPRKRTPQTGDVQFEDVPNGGRLRGTEIHTETIRCGQPVVWQERRKQKAFRVDSPEPCRTKAPLTVKC